MASQLEYISKGPSGYIVYKDDNTQFKLYFEFGGGNCVASIYLPEDWEKETNTMLTDKSRILDFISKQVIADQAPDCYFEIVDDKWINIMK